MKGPVPYIGGKSLQAADLIARFPPHVTYVEPFCGGAQVLFHKPPSKVEVLNDLDGELVTFLRVCQLHHDELLRYFAFSVHSRRWFELLRRQDPATLTDVQRAARFLYLQRCAWGGRVDSPTYNAPVTGAGKVGASYVRELITRTAARLERVQLENRPYEDVLKRFDRPTTFFYIDPPYVGMPYYRFNFKKEDFGVLADRLVPLRGKFLLSLNDHPLVRRVFARFHVERMPVRYSVARVKAAHELVIRNFA